MAQIRIILGTMNFGSQISKQKCPEFVNKFLEYGHKELDTAIMYVNGEAEKIIGTIPVCKDSDKVLLATKANPDKGFSYDGVIKQLNTSLQSLQVDRVDIFYLHWPDHKLPVEDTLKAVNQLYQEGKFKEFGLSNFKSWEVVNVYHICKANGWVLPTVYQGMYNALTRHVEGELFPALRKFGLRFYAYNPLAGGLLSGKYQFQDIEEKKPPGRFFGLGGKWAESYRKRYWKKDYFDGIEMIRSVLDNQYGEGKVSVAEAALRWMKHHSLLIPDDGIIIGGSKMEHLQSNLKAVEQGPLHEDVVEAFDAAWKNVQGNCPTYYR
ncbi:aflatoxin B1 aldehyde reductase member 2-like [Rhopilema esculentum]|uniref:aflatoxin B1 aldehyde reductase member 2-like n=1 Tax=Rhopilema esculentum TaxID=499914 RepID=UPI0031D2564B